MTIAALIVTTALYVLAVFCGYLAWAYADTLFQKIVNVVIYILAIAILLSTLVL